ncbi:MAG: DUF4268 domain-containing protein [Armatimonadetes bacterium]|nr:DUF4268 domain-containing protein [Armatimonadota bacterium]
MGFIVIKQGESLQIVPETSFLSERQEEYLHRILETEPRFLAVEHDDGEPLLTVVVASKFKLPSNHELDLLLLDSDGDFTLCELKKGNLTREIVGQILDYASELAEISVDDFRTQIEQAKEKLREQAQREGTDWEEEAFTDEALNESLKNPRLVLVGWRVDEDALRITRWLQQRGVKIECYEFDYFRRGDTEVFVPHNLTPLRKEEPEQPTRYRLRLKFWEDMLRRLGNRIPHHKKPTKYGSLDFGVGIRDVLLEWSGAHSELRVRLVVYNKDEHPNLVRKLTELLPTLREKTGEEWSKGETLRCFYVQTAKDSGVWVWEASEEVRNWGVETLVKLYNAIMPELREWTKEEGGEEESEE